jgi:hypothetical protein
VAPPTEANVPSVLVVTTVSPEYASSKMQAPSSQRVKLSQWWEQNQNDVLSSVIKVFGVTSNVLELVSLAEPAAKVFENAAKVLEDVQVPAFLSGLSPTVCTDKRANLPAIVGECRRCPRSDSANGAHRRRSQRIRAAATASHATANRQVAGVSA